MFDPNLLGRRASPFTQQQPDLAAVTLATELSCQFQQTQFHELILLHQDEFDSLKIQANTWKDGEGMVCPRTGYRFPGADSGDVLLVDGYSGRETIYAVTLSDSRLAAEFENILVQHLDGHFDEAELINLINNNREISDCQSISFINR